MFSFLVRTGTKHRKTTGPEPKSHYNVVSAAQSLSPLAVFWPFTVHWKRSSSVASFSVLPTMPSERIYLEPICNLCLFLLADVVRSIFLLLCPHCYSPWLLYQSINGDVEYFFCFCLHIFCGSLFSCLPCPVLWSNIVLHSMLLPVLELQLEPPVIFPKSLNLNPKSWNIFWNLAEIHLRVCLPSESINSLA